MFVGSSALAAMALMMPLVAAPESIVRGALTYVLLVYAVYVSSTVRRTLVVALLMTLPLVTAELEALLLSCLEKRPEDRPASAQVFCDRLQACAAFGRWTNARAAKWWARQRHERRSGVAGRGGSGDALAGNLTVHR